MVVVNVYVPILIVIGRFLCTSDPPNVHIVVKRFYPFTSETVIVRRNESDLEIVLRVFFMIQRPTVLWRLTSTLVFLRHVSDSCTGPVNPE